MGASRITSASAALANAGVVSKQDLDQARATLDQAQAQLHSLDAQVNEQQVQLHYYQVVAPRAGIVGDVPVRVGDRVLTTTPLTTVDRPGSLEAYIYVPIEKSAQLKMNLPVQIVDGSGNLLADQPHHVHLAASGQHDADRAGESDDCQLER